MGYFYIFYGVCRGILLRYKREVRGTVRIRQFDVHAVFVIYRDGQGIYAASAEIEQKAHEDAVRHFFWRPDNAHVCVRFEESFFFGASALRAFYGYYSERGDAQVAERNIVISEYQIVSVRYI